MLTNRMLSLQIISRGIAPYSGGARHQLHTSIKLLASSTSDSSDSGSDSDRESKKSKPEEPVKDFKKVNRKDNLSTLHSLMSDLNKKTPVSSKTDVAIPKKPPRPVQIKEPNVSQEAQFEAKLTSAAKTVAEKIGGNVKKTEMDLLDRLLKKVTSEESEKKVKSEPEPSLDQSDILKGVKVVCTSETDREFGSKNQRIERIRNISRKVAHFQVQAKDDRSTLRNLLQEQNRSKISERESTQSYDEKSRAVEQEKSSSILRELHRQQKRSEVSQEELKSAPSQDGVDGQSVAPKRPAMAKSTLWDLYRERGRSLGLGSRENKTFRFHNKNFGVFDPTNTTEPSISELSTWEEMEKKELKTLLYNPPQNYFQEMIQWTEQGKIWRFPIDNEQGMEEEQSVHFSEHVFMERHLKGWCPKKGPIRHFMELVCVGLSKNAFMTVQEKVDHIMWYKDYFGDKRDLLVELGALQTEDPAVLPKPTNKIDLGPEVFEFDCTKF